jgi:hypothetical protein
MQTLIEQPKILAEKTEDETHLKIDDMLTGSSITITEEQAKELWRILELMYDTYYQQKDTKGE